MQILFCVTLCILCNRNSEVICKTGVISVILLDNFPVCIYCNHSLDVEKTNTHLFHMYVKGSVPYC